VPRCGRGLSDRGRSKLATHTGEPRLASEFLATDISLPFLKKHILGLALLVQALLLFYHVDLLPMWGDERYTLETAAQPPGRILSALRVDVHPPFYYFLVKAWLRLPLPGSELVRARALSALVALLATLVFYRLWLAGAPALARTLFLGLWVLSPFLTLYARMARSYTLQLLLTVVAIRLAADWLRAPTSNRAMLRYIAGATLLLYTHYLPGLAVVLATAALGLWRRQWTHAIALGAMALAYAPWLGTLIATSTVVARAEHYEISSNGAVATLINLAYAFVAFNFGESIPVWAIVLGAALLPGIGWALLRAWRVSPHRPVLFLGVAIIAYIGAARWVTFAFVGARLLFLLPFYLLYLVRGLLAPPHSDTGRWISGAVYGGLLCIAVAGLSSYHRKQAFLNKGYLVDFDEIARLTKQESGNERVLVLLDRNASEAGYAFHRAGIGGRVEIVHDVLQLDHVLEEIRHHRLPLVWYIGYTRDQSVEQRLEQSLGDYQVRRYPFVPYSRMDREAMRVIGMSRRPEYLVTALELRAR